MTFEYSAYTYKTTSRPSNHHSYFNEDAHCDNEVNLILETNHNQSAIKQSTELLAKNEELSVVVNQTNPYYFMPIREQISTTALAGHHVTDSSLLSTSDLHHPTRLNLFDESLSENYFPSLASTMNNSLDTATVNHLNQTSFSLNDVDLAALFVSSLITTTPSTTSTTIRDPLVISHEDSNNDHEPTANRFNDAFLHQVTDLAFGSPSTLIDSQQSVGPPPGFENFRFESSLTNGLILSQAANNPTNLSTSNGIAETPVSLSDTINFSQLLQSTNVDSAHQQQATMSNCVGAIRSSSSSHSSFTSDEQSIFFPMLANSYSSSATMLHATSQIFSTATPSSTSTTAATNSVANLHIPNSLSLNLQQPSQLSSSSSSSLSRITSTTADSPLPKNNFDLDTKSIDGQLTPNHFFASSNSFFTNGNTDFTLSKPSNRTMPSLNHQSSITARTSTSSASSTTSSSTDEAFIQLNPKQQQLHNRNKLFNEEATSMFHFTPLPSNLIIDERQQQAVHDNISFLASMATASTPVTPSVTWPMNNSLHSSAPTSLDLNRNLQRKQSGILLRKQLSEQSRTPLHNDQLHSSIIQELIKKLNEFCYNGFDELHTLIQEQRCLQNAVNLTSTSISSANSSMLTLNGTSSCSSRVMIVPEYFIFKCKKVEMTSRHVFEVLAHTRPELRLHDRLGIFKSWEDAILTAELIHQEEENKLRLSTEHHHSYYMTDAVLQSAFVRVSHAIQLLGNSIQKVNELFRLITLNVSQSSPNVQQSPESTGGVGQFQSMNQQTKPPFIYRSSTGSLRTTP